jgi:NADPH2:quinone reductase
VIPAAMAIPVPAAWSYTEAAAAVIGLMTERNALSTAARLRPGTSRSGRDGMALRQLGLDELIATGEQDFADRVHEMTGGAGADVMVDHVGGPYLPANIRAAAVRGRFYPVSLRARQPDV